MKLYFVNYIFTVNFFHSKINVIINLGVRVPYQMKPDEINDFISSKTFILFYFN